MITIIHGDDTASSRKYFLEQKGKDSSVPIYDGENVTLTDLVQEFEGGGLFSDTKIIGIENFFTKRKVGKDVYEIVEYLNKHEDLLAILIWESKKITKKQISGFPKATSKLFKLPHSLFAFLDGIKPNNAHILIPLFHKTLAVSEAEFLFFMIIRQIRLLLAVLDIEAKDPIDEIKRLAPWQKTKLIRQASQFGKQQLIGIYKKLFIIEIDFKTGALPYPLSNAIDFFLYEI